MGNGSTFTGNEWKQLWDERKSFLSSVVLNITVAFVSEKDTMHN